MSAADTNDDPEALAEAKRLVANKQWPHTVKLGTPIQFGKETIESLVFQKGTFGVLKGMSITDVPTVDQIHTIASRLSGQPVKVFEMMDPDDAAEVVAIAIGFFARCQGAGKKLSAI